jgi:hypothetical protein
VTKVALLFLGFLLWACGSASSALAQIEIDVAPPEVDTLEAEEPGAILGLAAQQMDRGEAAKTLATIAQGLAQHPGDPKLLEKRGDIYATQPFFRLEAAEIYQR